MFTCNFLKKYFLRQKKSYNKLLINIFELINIKNTANIFFKTPTGIECASLAPKGTNKRLVGTIEKTAGQ